MAEPRRTTHSLPLRTVPPHLRASAHARGAAPAAPALEEPRLRRALVSAGLLSFAVVFGFAARWVLYGDAFRVRDVQMSELHAVDPIAVAAAAAVTGKTLFTVDRGKVAEAVAALPGVKSVVVRRDWPHGIAVDIVEAQGWGYWELNGQRVVVDENGTIIDHGRVPATQALVIYEQPSAPPPPAPDAQLNTQPAVTEPPPLPAPDPETVQLVRRLLDSRSFSVLRVTPTGFAYNRERGLTVHVANGPRVIFGDSHDFDFKVATWGALLDKIESQRLAVTEIDLRFGEHVVMR
jgi:hypothetical protein